MSQVATRSTRQLDHLLHTPDAFVRTPLPTIANGMAVIHAAPALGAGFLQYTAELAAGGTLAPALEQRFLYVVEGVGSVTHDRENHAESAVYAHFLKRGSYAYLPQGGKAVVTAETSMRIAVIEKRYVAIPGTAQPTAVFAHEEDVLETPLNGDPDLLVRSLLPADLAHDFAVNTMTYAPGAALAQVEVHVMEHGLLMLEGYGPYRLGDATYDVQQGDFIWMAPFCPQWFAAEGEQRAKYLIYKDWNRVPAL